MCVTLSFVSSVLIVPLARFPMPDNDMQVVLPKDQDPDQLPPWFKVCKLKKDTPVVSKLPDTEVLNKSFLVLIRDMIIIIC